MPTVTANRVISVAILLSIATLFIYTAAISRRLSRFRAKYDVGAEASSPAVKETVYGKQSFREHEGWLPEAFFDTPEAIRAADLILKRDQEQLQGLIDSGLDVNLTGKAGMSLLLWAFAEDNLDAFTLLLSAGADPDKRLTGGIRLRNQRPFFNGDTILFTCLRKRSWEFFAAALEYTRDVNQCDGNSDTLLHIASGPDGFGISETILQRMIDLGIDLDARDVHGTTAALIALGWNRPQICRQLLESGADPTISPKQGANLSVCLSRKITEYETEGAERNLAEANRIKKWLETREVQAGAQR